MPVTRADELDALAERVEKLTGADRQLDIEIVKALGLTGPYLNWPEDLYLPPDACCFTSSLDAAMSLMPEGYAWTLSTIGTENFLFWCSVSFPDEEAGSDQANSATPAIALSAACLRAQASIIREAGR